MQQLYNIYNRWIGKKDLSSGSSRSINMMSGGVHNHGDRKYLVIHLTKSFQTLFTGHWFKIFINGTGNIMDLILQAHKTC